MILGSTTYMNGEEFRNPGFLSLFVLFAGICLLFTGRYLAGVFGLIVGLNRWAMRVCTYLFLFTDVYPTFRLDQGGEDVREHAHQPAGRHRLD